MGTALKKVERLYFIEQVLRQRGGGITRAELARRTGVNRSTISKDIVDLSSLCQLKEDEESGKLRIDEDAYLDQIYFTLQEAAWIYLACKMMSDRTDRKNIHASKAITKLSYAIKGMSSSFAEKMLHDAEKIVGEGQRQDEQFNKSFSSLIEAWTAGKEVKIRHFSKSKEQIVEYIAGILTIIPYTIGQTFHCICYIPQEKRPRTFRIDRISKVTVLTRDFDLDSAVSLETLLRDAWGVWYNTETTTEVTIRFTKEVAPRLRETIWHPNQQIKELDDGGCLWSCVIAEPKEMLPWIRGWGKDAVVLKPLCLREQMLSEIADCLKNYSTK